MKHSNIKLLFTKTNLQNKDIEYIFLISEDKYEYMLALCNYSHFYYSLYTLNKITKDFKLKKRDFVLSGDLYDIIKETKNVEEYKCVNLVGNNNTIIKYIRKLKIKNILQ